MGECFWGSDFARPEYTYRVCPYVNVTQFDNSNNLLFGTNKPQIQYLMGTWGTWGNWTIANGVYSTMNYYRGDRKNC